MSEANVTIRFGTKDTETVKRALRELGDEGQRALDKLEQASSKPSAGLKAINTAAQGLRVQFESSAARLGTFGAALASLGPAGLVAAAAIGTTTLGISKAISEAAQGERALAKIEGQIRATGSASGLTARQIVDMAEGISRSTMATEDEAKAAATSLMAFRGVAGDTFGEVLRLSQDLAAAGFGSLSENAAKLGKALQDPADGLAGLTRLGLAFTTQQKDLISTLVESGETAKAQRVILDALQQRVGGTGAAESDTLIGAFDGLQKATAEWFETVGENSGLLATFKDMLNGIASAIDNTTKAMSPEAELASALATAAKQRNPSPALRNDIGRLSGIVYGADLESQALEAMAVSAAHAAAEQHNLELAIEQRTKTSQDSDKRLIASFDQMVKENIADGERKRKALEHDIEVAIAGNEKMFKRWGEQEKAYQDIEADMLRERQRGFDQFYRDGVNLFTEAFLDPMEGGFEDSFERMFSILKRQLLAMAVEAAARPILVPIYSTLYGGGPGAALSGAGNATSALGGAGNFGSLLSGGGLTSSIFPGLFETSIAAPGLAGNQLILPSQFALSNPTLAGGLKNLTSPAGIAGGFAGSMLSDLLFNHRQGPGSAIGGTLGSIGGAFATTALTPILGPLAPFLGPAIGSFLGSTVGGLFGARPSARTEESILNLRTGGVREGDLGAGKDSPENREAVNTFVAAVKQLGDIFSATGGQHGVNEVLYSFGASGSRLDINGVTQAVSSPEQAFALVTQRFVETMEGLTPRLKTALDAIDFTDVTAGLMELERVMAAEGLRTSTLATIRDELAQMTDPKKYAFDKLEASFAGMLETFDFTAEELVDVEKWMGNKRVELAQQFADEVVEIIDDSAERAREAAELAAQLTQDSSDRVQALLRSSAASQLDALQGQVRTSQSLFDVMERAQSSLSGALLRLDLDPSLSNLTPQQLFDATQSRFNDLSRRSVLGDQSALGEIGDFGISFMELAKQSMGVEKSNAVLAQVRNALGAARDTAGRQKDIAAEQLGVLEAQLIELRRIASGGSGAPTAAIPPPGVLDFATLTQAYGNSGAPLPGSAAFGAFEGALLDMIGRTTDRDLILRNISEQTARFDAGGGDPAKRILDAFTLQAHNLGIPGYAGGGTHVGGLAITGERGPEIGAWGSTRFYSAGQTRDIVSGAAMNVTDLTTAARATTFEAANIHEQMIVLNRNIVRLERLLQNVVDKQQPATQYAARA